ncbi:MAG: acyltransferase domain-containing protein, partial [Terrimicrobiaceae bacterium]
MSHPAKSDVIRTRGVFGDAYDIPLLTATGANPARLAILFSGQGSARPGMFREVLARLPAMQNRFAHADQLARELGLPPVSSFLVDASNLEGETLNRVRNLATFTVQIGCFDAVVASGRPPFAITGFSLGEFAALAASGIISFEDGFRMIHERDLFSAPSNQLGFMMAVAASPKRLKELLANDEFFVSCINTPTQTTISVLPGYLEPVKETLKRNGILVSVLVIPQPYHTPLMRPVTGQLIDYLRRNGTRFFPPKIPVLSCVNCQWIDEQSFPGIDWPDLIGRLNIEQVDFIRQIEILADCGCGSFLEIGPGQALQKFTTAILTARPHRIVTLDSLKLPESVSAIDCGESTDATNPFLKLLQKVIAKVTGYQIERISIEKQFQADLGIDSLKTTEIMVEVLKESGRRIDPAIAITGFKDIRSALDVLNHSLPVGTSEDENLIPAVFVRSRWSWQPRPLPEPFEPESAEMPSFERFRTVELDEIIAGTISPSSLIQDLRSSQHPPGTLNSPESNSRMVVILRGDRAGNSSLEKVPEADSRGFLDRIARIIEWFQALIRECPEPAFDLVLVSSSKIHPHNWPETPLESIFKLVLMTSSMAL